MKTRPVPTPAIGRRSLVWGLLGAGAALTTGCSALGPTTPSPQPTSSKPPSSEAANLSADPTVSQSYAVIATERDWLANIAVTFPRLAQRCQPLLTTFEAHLDLLGELLGGPPTASSPESRPVPDTRVDASAEVGRTSTALAVELAGLSLTSHDTAVARAVASMAAGVTQATVAGGWSATATISTPFALTPSLAPVEVSAIQEVLAGEHASVWWYGVLGGRTSATATPRLFTTVSAAYAAHVRQRDVLTAALTGLPEVPTPAQPAYPIAWPVTTAAEIAAAARVIEAESSARYSWLVSQTREEPRGWAIAALRNAAIRELDFQGTPENFPGADEFADR